MPRRQSTPDSRPLLPTHAGLLAQLLGHTLRLAPSLGEGVLGRQRHLLLRGYASAHLAAVFATYVGGLPGTGGALQPAELQQPLSIVGLWDPTVAVGMLPVLALLLLATLHSSVDRAVHSGAQQQHHRWAREGSCRARWVRLRSLGGAAATRR